MLQSSCKIHEYVLVDTFCIAVASSQAGILDYTVQIPGANAMRRKQRSERRAHFKR